MAERRRDGLSIAVNLIVLAVLAVITLGPDGVLRQKWTSWRHESAQRERLTEVWRELVPTDEVAVVEFIDYECPFCRTAHEVVKAWQRESGGRVHYVHFPLTMLHPRADDGARAAICGAEQGRFDEVHEQLLTTQDWTEEDRPLISVAIAGGVPNLDEFRLCFSDARTTRRLEEDAALARSLAITGTPTFLAKDALRTGRPGGPDLLAWIEER